MAEGYDALLVGGGELEAVAEPCQLGFRGATIPIVGIGRFGGTQTVEHGEGEFALGSPRGSRIKIDAEIHAVDYQEAVAWRGEVIPGGGHFEASHESVARCGEVVITVHVPPGGGDAVVRGEGGV